MEPSETKFEPHVLLAEHGISQAEFDTTQLEWDLLREIAQDHTTSLPSLQSAANYISQRLQTVNGIHSLPSNATRAYAAIQLSVFEVATSLLASLHSNWQFHCTAT